MTDKQPIAYVIPSLPRRDFLDGTEPCREVDPEVFFPIEGGSPRAARRICGGCEVREECRDWAITAGIEYGVWGGESMHAWKNLAQRESMRKLRALRKAEAS